MIQFFKNNIEPRKKLRTAEIIVLIALVLGSNISLCGGVNVGHSIPGKVVFVISFVMKRNTQDEDYSSDNTVCDVTYSKGDQQLVVSYSYEVYTQLKNNTITAYEFKTCNATVFYFDHKDVSLNDV